MSKRTCYTVGSQKPTEKSQSFLKSCTPQPTQLPNFFLLISTLFLFPCTAAAALPRAADSAVIPLMYTCMYTNYDRSTMASSELYERSIFVGVNIFEHCHLISVKPLG